MSWKEKQNNIGLPTFKCHQVLILFYGWPIYILFSMISVYKFELSCLYITKLQYVISTLRIRSTGEYVFIFYFEWKSSFK